jgi:iodotyrosine deiodinase
MEPSQHIEDMLPYTAMPYSPDVSLRQATAFRDCMLQRRSIRHFSDAEVPLDTVKAAIEAATTAPSGANKQPWTFCLVSNPALKKAIRMKAEEEEYENYHGRMGDQWLKDLAPLHTDQHKPFLETAPYLIVVFKKPYDLVDGRKVQNYYVSESVGIAVGFLLAALHHAGLSTLTHTPSPMGFLAQLLERPPNERAYLLIPVGLAHPDAKVPNIAKKPVNNMIYEYF